jgi:hypothetical protein
MKTSTTRAKHFRPTISKIVIAVALASVMGGIAVTPTHAKGNDDRKGYQGKGGQKGEQRGYRDRREYRPQYQHPNYYSQPVYAPPPVYYAPQPSPGISLFLPLNIRF